MQILKYILAVFILIIPLNLNAGEPVSNTDVQFIQNDMAAAQLSAYYDLRNRESYVQVTNVTNFPVTIHIQIFQQDRGCTELNFDDVLTPNDTVVYDLDNVVKNNGDPAPVNLADDSYGYVVVSDRELDNLSTVLPTLIGNFRIVDDADYEYRVNMSGVTQFNPPVTDLTEISLQAYFNTADGAWLADLVGFTYDGSNSASVRNFTPGINFDVFVFDMQEEPLSCSRRNFACGRVMNYGINEDYPASRGGNVICPGGGLANPFGGYVHFENGALGTPVSSNDIVFVNFIGLNNDDGTGSMDVWIDPTDKCPSDPDKEDPGICGCGEPDDNTDGDSELDCNDGCPDDSNKTEPGRCGCGVDDEVEDPDQDGVCGDDDNCPYDPNKTEEGICGCGTPDTDTDSDGTPDCIDNCPDNPELTEPGECGCDTSDMDSDGVLDCQDDCPNNPELIMYGPCGCDTSDMDGDGVLDCEDMCPGIHDESPECIGGDDDDDAGPDCSACDTIECIGQQCHPSGSLCVNDMGNCGDD